MAISVNALWLQTERHPLPLFRPSQQRHAAAEPPPTAPKATEAQPGVPARPLDLHPREAEAKPAPKPSDTRKPDAIGELIGTAAPTPLPPERPGHRKQPAGNPAKPSAAKPSAAKPSAAKPSAVKPPARAKPAGNALTALIERTTTSR